MLTQMEFIQEHMKGIYEVFRVEERSSSAHLKLWENQGWNSKRYKEGFRPLYLQRSGNQGWNYYKGE